MDNIVIIQWNARSINSNAHEFKHFLSRNIIHIVLLNETWLHSENVSFAGYNFIRRDSLAPHRGVAILLSVNIEYELINTYSDISMQNVCIKIKLCDGLSFNILNLSLSLSGRSLMSEDRGQHQGCIWSG